MKRLHVMTLAFNSFDFVHRAVIQFEQQKPDYPIASRTLVDQRYPNVESQYENSRKLMELAEVYGWNYCRPSKNHGCHESWNWVIRDLGLGDGDVLWGCDPDGNPLQPKFLDAAMDVFNNSHECFTVQLNRPCVDKMGIPRVERKIGRTAVYDYQQLVAWSLGSFDCGWVNRVGGMKARHPLYGWTEHAMVDAIRPYGGRWYILKDYFDDHLKAADQEFVSWKLASVEHRTQLDFADWLKGNQSSKQG